MGTMHGGFPKDGVIDSPLGKTTVDSQGAAVSGVRMDVSRAYAGIPALLQKVIDEKDAASWKEIACKIDYIYDNLDHSLAGLDRETGFGVEVRAQVGSGKKLFFKPNLVSPMVIDWRTHGEDLAGAPICTEWPLVAALMRWFHDRLEISYHQMALGEAATATFIAAALYSRICGGSISTEAVFEGRSGDFYGGWGFYFVRRYLSDCHSSSHEDDPMKGYEDSVAGRFIPPGKAGDRLMVYDLNKIQDDPSKGRTVPVPDGANFQEITLHKVIVGGDPRDPDDRKDYPGCVMVNVPKLKIHFQDLITNAVKNLGIGLYPTLCGPKDSQDHALWKYSCPSTSIPNYKGRLPHMPWVFKIDEATNLPVKDENGEVVLVRTAGMSGTQADVIRAVQGQNVFMLHVVDAIEMINLNHSDGNLAARIPEGYIWSSLDCVAVDLLCARYCCKTVSMSESLKLREEKGWPTEFVRHVPVTRIEGRNIVTAEGLDSPLFRYNLYRYAEKRGVGQQMYHVVGWDSLTASPLASVAGHLGRVDNLQFLELITQTMYYNPGCILWDLQETIFSYARAHDALTGSSLLNEFLDNFDENHDGVIDYDENGRKGFWMHAFHILAQGLDLQVTERFGDLKGGFYIASNHSLKPAQKDWHPQGHDFAREYLLVWTANAAHAMSQSEVLNEDRFVQGMTWGKGRWPSWQTATHMLFTGTIYGSHLAGSVSLGSVYGATFCYADKAFNGGAYTGPGEVTSDPNSIHAYFDAVSRGAPSLDFTLYVPVGYGSLEGVRIPNVEETEDPGRIFTAHFNGGMEVW